MALSVEDVRDFIRDVDAARRNWLDDAKDSWRELKKENRASGFRTLNPNSAKRAVKVPIWRSTFKIRQPLHYARTPEIAGKDTTGGDDPTGRTAAICLERLGRGIMRSFDFDDVMFACRDDALATNIGQARVFYTCDTVKERVRRPVNIQQDEQGNQSFVDADGEDVDAAIVQQSEDGYYIETDEEVDVENERVYLEPVTYTDFLMDPDVKRWEKRRRAAFQYEYSKREFKRIFGFKAWLALPMTSKEEKGTKKAKVKVTEYWDLDEGEVYWLPENGPEFITPIDADGADPYQLEHFFPCPKPMVWNAPTDSFYPVTEHYQLADIIEDIHNIFGRIFVCTKAIRSRILFDNSVTELVSLINEANEADALGVTNLAQSLANGGGKLDNLIAAMPIEPFVNSLKSLYESFEHRLNLFYQLSGTSDLLRGQTDQVERTFGEQQLKAKYALNLNAETQRDMQRFARDCIELLCETATKMFSDEALERYIAPQTLDAEDKQRYAAAIDLLRNDRKKRFRVELETDSMLVLNEDYDKAAASEMVTTISSSMEKICSIAETNKELAIADLKLLLHLVRKFRQGKLFEDELTQSVQAAIAKMEQAQSAPPQPDLEQQKLQLENAKIQLEREKAEVDTNLRIREYQLKSQQTQIDYQKLQNEFATAQAEFQTRQLELEILREKNQIEAQKVGNDTVLKQSRLEIDAQIAASEQRLAELSHGLEQYKVQLDEKEKYATEARLQFEAEMKAVMGKNQQPIVIQNHMPAAVPTQKISTPVRDEAGNIISVSTQEVPVIAGGVTP